MEFNTEVPNNDIFETEFETIPVHYVMKTNQSEEVEFVYNDDIGIPDDYQKITNIILEDGTTAMIINGTLITDDGQGLVIQDEVDFNQCSVAVQNELQNQFIQIVVPQDIQNTTENVISYVQEETAIESEPNNQIFYIQEENDILEPTQEQCEIAENPNQFGQLIQLADDEIIVDENGRVVELQELISKYQLNGDFECTLAADGSFSFSSTTDTRKKHNISEIKGKNIATGEVISISQHLDKFKKGRNFASNTPKNGNNAIRFDATRSKSSIKDLKKLINKKIPIRQTDKGKNLVAKITKIIKKHPPKSPINTNKKLLTNVKQSIIIPGKKKSQPIRLPTEAAAVETDPKPNETELVIMETDLTVVKTDPTLIEIEPVTQVSESAVEIDLMGVQTDPTFIETEPLTLVSESAVEIDLEAVNTDPTFIKTESEVVKTETTVEIQPEPQQPNFKVIVQKKNIQKEAFEVISKTLSGLMNMDSVVNMLKNKTLVVTMMEKVFDQETKKYSKNVSYCIGYMIREYELDSADGKFLVNWKFILDGNSSEIILGQNHVASINQKSPSRKDKSYANLTIEITQNAAGKRNTKVIINPPSMFQCKTCGISYRTSTLLKLHSLQQHNDPPPAPAPRNPAPGLECKKCSIKFKTLPEAEKHTRLSHSKDNSLGVYECVDCKQRFKTPPQIRKHMESHFISSFCSICQIRFQDIAALKKHTMNKHTTKPEIESKENENHNIFTCNICGKKFSRHSNLLRHAEIHKGAGANYQCAICYCSYHFVSSLTRHIISTHVEKKPIPEVPHTNLLELPNDMIEEQIEGFEFLQNDQMVQMIPLENISEDALEQVLQEVPTGPEIVEETESI